MSAWLGPHAHTSTLSNAGTTATGRWCEGDGRKKDEDQTCSGGKALTGDKDVPLFSMVWIRLTRARGAVSGGVNCSLRSGIETAETTTQITVALLAQSPPTPPPPPLSKATEEHWHS